MKEKKILLSILSVISIMAGICVCNFEKKLGFVETNFSMPNAKRNIVEKQPENFSEEQTKVSLIANYDNVTYEVNTASIRFGTTLLKNDFLFDGATYGVFIAASKNLEKTFTDYYNAFGTNSLSEYESYLTSQGIKYISRECTPASVNEAGDSIVDETGDYFQFAAVINGLEKNLSDDLTATCYMEYNNTLYLMGDRTYSIVSLAQAYVDESYNYNFSESQLNFLKNISNSTIEGITLSNSTVFMEIGKEKTLEAVVGAGKKVIWETTDENIVSVDNGKLTALKRGEVTITASIENEPEFTASCKVYVGAAEDKITYTYGDGTESMPSQSTTDEHPVGSWYQNGVVGTATMKGGIFEIKTSKEIADNKLAQLRFIFAKNNDTNFYIGSFYMVFTITNETAKDMNYQYRLSSGTDTDKETVASGSSKQVIAKMTTKSDSEYLNIKLRSYGIGTVTISDIYLVPLSE